MTYEELTLLCEEQWVQVYKGDVIGLHLTNASAEQLEVSAVLEDVEGVISYHKLTGGLVMELPNPVTLSIISVRGGARHNTATVSHGQLGEPDEIPL